METNKSEERQGTDQLIDGLVAEMNGREYQLSSTIDDEFERERAQKAAFKPTRKQKLITRAIFQRDWELEKMLAQNRASRDSDKRWRDEFWEQAEYLIFCAWPNMAEGELAEMVGEKIEEKS